MTQNYPDAIIVGGGVVGCSIAYELAAEEARVVRQTACRRPLSADGLPVVGRVPGWANVYVAAGAGRNGILLGPGIGRSLAQLITRGRAELWVEPFALDRLLPGPAESRPPGPEAGLMR